MKMHKTRLLWALCLAIATTTAVSLISARAGATTDLTPRHIGDVHRPARGAERIAHHPAVAVVLGGGGLRGFAHIGVLRALEDAGITPDIVVGTSAGAVVGAAYASGLPPKELETMALGMRLFSLLDLTMSSTGLIQGKKLAGWVESVTAGVPIERFPIRFAAVATDLDTEKAVLLDSGSAGQAVRASASVPGINVPVAYANGHLIDGGVAGLVPVRFARAMGADVVIAVDIYCQSPNVGGLGAPTVIQRVMHAQSCMVARPEMAEADLLIAPVVEVPGLSATDEQARAIQAGYDAALAALGENSGLLKQLVARVKLDSHE